MWVCKEQPFRFLISSCNHTKIYLSLQGLPVVRNSVHS